MSFLLMLLMLMYVFHSVVCSHNCFLKLIFTIIGLLLSFCIGFSNCSIQLSHVLVFHCLSILFANSISFYSILQYWHCSYDFIAPSSIFIFTSMPTCTCTLPHFFYLSPPSFYFISLYFIFPVLILSYAPNFNIMQYLI